jgi:hypothetical protein
VTGTLFGTRVAACRSLSEISTHWRYVAAGERLCGQTHARLLSAAHAGGQARLDRDGPLQVFTGDEKIETTMRYVQHVPKTDAAAKGSAFIAARWKFLGSR